MKTVEHLIYDQKSWKKKTYLRLLKKKERRKFEKTKLQDYYFEQMRGKSPIPQKALDEIIDFSKPLKLENFASRNGNVSPYELMCLGSIVAHCAPKRILEIGTFDGNTTLQLAINAPDDARIDTLDLPPNGGETVEPVLKSDLAFIHDEKKRVRKFESHHAEKKITQHFGDSTAMDFSRWGELDFVFIDGGHSYECVKSDTENALKVAKGIIMWHDFTPFFGGVFTYLNELSKELPLINIEGTNLVMWQRGSLQ